MSDGTHTDRHSDDCICVVQNVPNTSCQCGFLDRDSRRNFEAKHAIVHEDHLTELKRRRALWASCPPSRGVSLDAATVPMATLEAAISELHAWRANAARIKTRGTA